MYLIFFSQINYLFFFFFLFLIKNYTWVQKYVNRLYSQWTKKPQKPTPPPTPRQPKATGDKSRPRLKAPRRKRGKEESTESQRRLLHGEEVNVFKLWGHLTIRQIIDHSFRIWMTTKTTGKSPSLVTVCSGWTSISSQQCQIPVSA